MLYQTKNIRFFSVVAFFVVGFSAMFAQNRAVVLRVEFACPGGVTVIYNLTAAQPVDVKLYYSTDTITWLLAQTVTGNIRQNSGTNKIMNWDNFADNVHHGVFIKLEVPQPPVGDCVWINGVCWAERNVDRPGTFAASPWDAGMFYQWNRNIGWSATNPMINSNGSTTWDNTTPAGTTWERANDPSPAGFRVPTREEIRSLLDGSNVTNIWTTENGVNGIRFTDRNNGNSIFLPAAGYRSFSNGTLGDVGSWGYCWSSTQDGSYAYDLYFLSSNAFEGWSSRSYGFSVRCVAER